MVEMDDAWVVHEDDDILVVDKPAGLVTDRTVDRARDHLLAVAGRWLGARGRASELWAVHRLDAHTSGLVMIAKKKARATELMQCFERREIEKTYVAIACGSPASDRFETHDYLVHERGKTRAVKKGGRVAHTEFVVRERRRDLALVEARPKTGRTHQIRVHLADGGLPILGDPLYAPPAIAARSRRMLLHARRLGFRLDGRDYAFEAPHPIEFEAALDSA
jgi:RluA family pseudouridine synthase